MTLTKQGTSEMSANPNDLRRKIDIFVRRRVDSAMDLITREREAATAALKESLAARGHGLIFDPLDPRFDQIQLSWCEAMLRAKANALFEAYEVYDVAPDDAIWKELNRHKSDLELARGQALKQTAIGIARRTGRNTAPGIARAESLGRQIARSTHALLKSFACEIEKRKQMWKKSDSPSSAFAKFERAGVRVPKKQKLQKRETVIFAAILLELIGLKYSSFLQAREIRPKWWESGPADYPKSYQAGDPWRKKVQDEKTRAKQRMDRYTSAQLADAFNAHLPDLFGELARLLSTRALAPRE
jgi:hypothetical protein